jgi:hypothetical protein
MLWMFALFAFVIIGAIVMSCAMISGRADDRIEEWISANDDESTQPCLFPEISPLITPVPDLDIITSKQLDTPISPSTFFAPTLASAPLQKWYARWFLSRSLV